MIFSRLVWQPSPRQLLRLRIGVALGIVMAAVLAIVLEFTLGNDGYQPAREVTLAVTDAGWEITAIHPASQAYDAGLRPGDRFLAGAEETDRAWREHPAGLDRTGSVVVERAGRLHWFYINDISPDWLTRSVLALAAFLFVLMSAFTWYRADPSRASFTFLILGVMAGLTLMATPWASRGHSWALTINQITALGALTSLPIFLYLFPLVRPVFGARLGVAPEYLWLGAATLVGSNFAAALGFIDYFALRPFFYHWSLLMLGMALWITGWRWRQEGRAKSQPVGKQVRIVGIGAMLAFLPLCLVLLPELIFGYALFDELVILLTTIIWPVAMAYAMLRYRVMDVDLVVRRGFIQIVVGAVFVLYLMAVQWLVSRSDEVPMVMRVLTVALAAVGALPVMGWVATHLDRAIYGRSYDSREALATLARTLSSVTDADELITAGLNLIQETLQATTVILYERVGDGPPQPVAWLRRFEERSAGHRPFALSNDHPLLSDPRANFWQAGGTFWSSEGLPPVVASPNEPSLLVIRRVEASGEELGALDQPSVWLLGLAPRISGIPYARDDVLLLETLLQNLAIAISNVRRYSQLAESHQALSSSEQRYRTLSQTDPLTGLANRRMLFDRLELLSGTQQSITTMPALIFIDLDRFKVINDSLGHASGDQLLLTVSRRLRESVRERDLVARLGGDEFAVLLQSMTSSEGLLAIAQRIHNNLRLPVLIDGRELVPAASIGLAVGNDLPLDPDEFLRRADVAMYHAKTSGVGISLYAPALDVAVRDRLNLELDLRMAIERNELRLEYQPIISLATGRMVEVEALLRWHHPTRGRVPPGEFIPLAERSDLILTIGAWVLETACRQGQQWRHCFGEATPIVSVNLSTRQLVQPNLVSQVAGLLELSGLPAQLLRLEITESLAMEQAISADITIQALRALGVHFAIDDFGTGYSSLSYLRNLRVEGLKLDRSFTKEISDSRACAIIQAIAVLGPQLGMTITAEGIETREQLALLRSLGCLHGQGFWFSRPVPPESITDLLVSDYHWALDDDPFDVDAVA